MSLSFYKVDELYNQKLRRLDNRVNELLNVFLKLMYNYIFY